MMNTMETYEDVTAWIAKHGADDTDPAYVLKALHTIAQNAAGDIRDGQRIPLMTGILADMYGPQNGPGDYETYQAIAETEPHKRAAEIVFGPPDTIDPQPYWPGAPRNV